MREGVPAPGAGANWNHAAIRRITLSDLYARHTADEVRGMVSAEVAARLDPGTEYGIWHFNTKRTSRSYASRVGPNGKEYTERQRTRAKPKEEWIAVPVPLGEGHGVPRGTVEAARETMRSHPRHYRQTSRVWEFAGGVFYCVQCDRMMSFANVKRRNGKRMAYYRCQGHRRNGHKQGCPNARHYRAAELEDLAWRFVHGLLTDPDRLRRGLDALVEEKRRGMRGDLDKEARLWLERIADADRQRARAQDLAIEGLLSPEELRSKLVWPWRALARPPRANWRPLEAAGRKPRS
jgi:hypothetical protein